MEHKLVINDVSLCSIFTFFVLIVNLIWFNHFFYKFFQVDTLKFVCEHSLEKHINNETALYLLSMADQLQTKVLKVCLYNVLYVSTSIHFIWNLNLHLKQILFVMIDTIYFILDK